MLLWTEPAATARRPKASNQEVLRVQSLSENVSFGLLARLFFAGDLTIVV